MAQVYEAIFEIFDRGVPVHQQQFMGPFTWKEDDPSARIILESSFGLHANTWLLGSVHARFLFNAVAKQDGGQY